MQKRIFDLERKERETCSGLPEVEDRCRHSGQEDVIQIFGGVRLHQEDIYMYIHNDHTILPRKERQNGGLTCIIKLLVSPRDKRTTTVVNFDYDDPHPGAISPWTAPFLSLSRNSLDMEAAVPYPRGATVFAASCAVVFSVVGVAGNLCTAVALLKCLRLRQQATTAFVVSLCLSDLLFCAVNLPLTASRYIHQAWVLGETLCQLFPFFFYGNVAVSLLSMVAITVNRYILISYHNLYDKLYTMKNIAMMLLFAWIFGFSMMVPPLIGIWGQLGLDPPTFSCTVLKKNNASPKKFLFIFGFVLPCIVIISSYSCIYWKVRQSRSNLMAHRPNNDDPRNITSVQKLRHDDIRLTRLMLIIFCCFLMCFLPLMVVNVADDDIKYPTLHVLASVLAWASSVINPFIYAGTNRQYRTAYKKLLFSEQAEGNVSNTETHQEATDASASFSVSASEASANGARRTYIPDFFQFDVATGKMQPITTE